MTIANAQDKPEATVAGPKLELIWPHKDEFLLVPKDDGGKPVWAPRDHPAANEVRLTRFVGVEGEINEMDPHLDNTVFVGDSIDAMRVMCEVPEFAARYRGKVKLIYADPPFNTGQAFVEPSSPRNSKSMRSTRRALYSVYERVKFADSLLSMSLGIGPEGAGAPLRYGG